jgi:hypothetical protein
MNTTDYVLFAVIGVLLGWEIYTLLNTSKDDTITASIHKWSRRPLVPFLFGLLAGHFFWT